MSRKHSHKDESPKTSPKSSPKGSSKPHKLKDLDMPCLWLGRPGHSLKMGIIGLPNVGKTGVFNILSGSSNSTENFPYCTTESIEARTPVQDPRLDKLCDMYQPQLRTPAFLTVVDNPGLARGAHDGKGIGNHFLSDLGSVDALYHVVRAFDDLSIVHIDDTIDPVRDIDTVITELIARDLAHATDALDKLRKSHIDPRSAAGAKTQSCISILDKCIQALKQGKQIRFLDLHASQIDFIDSLAFLTAKPSVFCVNVSSKDYCRRKNKWLLKIKEYVDQNCPGEATVPCSVSFEEYGVNEHPECPSVVEKIIKCAYNATHMIMFYTRDGVKECKAWTIRDNTACDEASGHVHSDFKEKFVAADVWHFSDIDEYPDEKSLHAAGKIRQEGRHYVVRDGDVIHFRIGGIARGQRGKSH